MTLSMVILLVIWSCGYGSTQDIGVNSVGGGGGGGGGDRARGGRGGDVNTNVIVNGHGRIFQGGFDYGNGRLYGRRDMHVVVGDKHIVRSEKIPGSRPSPIKGLNPKQMNGAPIGVKTLTSLGKELKLENEQGLEKGQSLRNESTGKGKDEGKPILQEGDKRQAQSNKSNIILQKLIELRDNNLKKSSPQSFRTKSTDENNKQNRDLYIDITVTEV